MTISPSGDTASDTALLETALHSAAVSGEPVAFTGGWNLTGAKAVMPDVFSQLVVRGDATFRLVDRAGASGWGSPLTIELGKSNGNLVHIESGLTFSGGGSVQSAPLPSAAQHSCLRVTRNPFLDPDEICNLKLLRIDNLNVVDRISIGLVFGSSSSFQWIDEAIINGGVLTGTASQYPRAQVEFGSSVGITRINGLQGDADSYVQTEPETETDVSEVIIHDSTVGIWQFGGRAENQRYELHNCNSLKLLQLNSASYIVRGGEHRLSETVAWYRSNLDIENVKFLFADDAEIIIYHALSGVPDVQLNRRFTNCSFMYQSANPDWLAIQGSAMVRVRPSADARLHGLTTAYNVFDPRCYCSIYAVGTGLNSYRDKVAGERAFMLGEFSQYGGDVSIHAEDGDQTAVRGVPLFFNADVSTAPMRFRRSGDGWKQGVAAGQSVIDEYAVFDSTAEFYGSAPPSGGGVKGDRHFFGGKAWRAERTSPSNAAWTELPPQILAQHGMLR